MIKCRKCKGKGHYVGVVVENHWWDSHMSGSTHSDQVRMFCNCEAGKKLRLKKQYKTLHK